MLGVSGTSDVVCPREHFVEAADGRLRIVPLDGGDQAHVAVQAGLQAHGGVQVADGVLKLGFQRRLDGLHEPHQHPVAGRFRQAEVKGEVGLGVPDRVFDRGRHLGEQRPQFGAARAVASLAGC